MTPFQIALLVELLVVLVLCWFKGGHPERLAAGWLLLVTVVEDGFLPDLAINGFHPLEALVCVLTAGVFVWIAMTRDRWWAFAAAGSTLLVVVLQLYILIAGGMGLRAYISARIGLTALLLLTMLAGVIERRLAGEQAVFDRAGGWRRRPAA